jgi:hypothetical protein
MKRDAAGIEIRRASRTDVPAVLHCLAVAFEPFRSRYTPGAFEGTVLTPDSAERRMREMTVLAAVDPLGAVLGTIALAAAGAGEGHVRGMAVLPRL